jgi:large subunit ribosomal protein L29
MGAVNAGDIRKLSDDEVRSELLNLRKEHFNLRFQMATGEFQNHARVRQVKRTIARLKTILNERKRATSR